MSQLSLFENHEFFGDWRLAGSDRASAGKLTYTSERARLEVFDAFTPLQGAISISDSRPIYPAIHGTSAKGDAISLLEAQSLGAGVSLRSGGARRPETVATSFVVVGAHIEPNTLFQSMDFFIPGLAAWLGMTAVSESIELDAEGRFSRVGLTIGNRVKETTSASSIDAELDWCAGAEFSVERFGSTSINVLGWFSIRPASARPMQWFFEHQSAITTLLTFLAGNPMSCSAIQGRLSDGTFPVSILATLSQSDPCTYRAQTNFFVPRADLEAGFSAVVNQWLQELGPVLTPSKLVMSAMSSRKLWLHVEFLSLIQALEGFHRGRHHGTYMDEHQYRAIQSTLEFAIPETVEHDHKAALRSRIRYGNQISLAKRLTQLKDILNGELARAVLWPDGKIPRSWISTRNYLSHWDEELRDDALDNQEMYNANVRMTHLLRLLYLKLAGVPEEALLKCALGSSRTAEELRNLNVIARRKVDPSAPPGIVMVVSAGNNDASNPEARVNGPDQ